ncbi:hypothetical protein WJX72_008478 [[Myrmecia] bisecta]|uniref:Choline monooxygenase, chloroplastic n=1 Tax=[Myrmecia] bisecta TaxID=41462 RepID=A0AAW1Q7T8_9CHLO
MNPYTGTSTLASVLRVSARISGWQPTLSFFGDGFHALTTAAVRHQHVETQVPNLAGCDTLEPWPSAGEPIQEATTPPSSWYLSPLVAHLEHRTVFQQSWQAVGHLGQVSDPGSFFTGSLLNMGYLVCRGQDGILRAFHNVCRHHAAPVACQAGRTERFVCPYHGWTYGLDGGLQKATRLKGIKNFRAADMGLVPIQVDTWGQLIFLHFGAATETTAHREAGQLLSLRDWLGRGGEAMQACGMADQLQHVATRTYDLNCNWKVFCDNYLDGGYHVPFAHKSLASGLDIGTYSSMLHERVSIQSCKPATQKASGGTARLGNRDAAYAFVYPNLMINRYGPWMDTNLVTPLAVDRCRVVFDYLIDPAQAADTEYIQHSLQASDEVQQEDIQLCEGVQRGLTSPAYDVGRYAPGVEQPMFHFHQMLHRDLSSTCPRRPSPQAGAAGCKTVSV